MVKPKLTETVYLSRPQLARRWNVSRSTIWRKEREGLLKPTMIPGKKRATARYRLADIEALESANETEN
jgi:hypothetical protein